MRICNHKNTKNNHVVSHHVVILMSIFKQKNKPYDLESHSLIYRCTHIYSESNL